MIRKLQLGIDCLCIPCQDPKISKSCNTLLGPLDREIAVSLRLREWNSIFDDWAMFVFGRLNHFKVCVCHCQFVIYFIRGYLALWSPLDKFEFWLFLYKLRK